MTTDPSVKKAVIKQTSYRVVNSLIACCHETDRTHDHLQLEKNNFKWLTCPNEISAFKALNFFTPK